jgi:UDP:flavonoid glycosyltransferase YjiC (YdhE family)
MIAPGLNAFRKTVGLEPVRRTLLWVNSPQRVIGLFPEWFVPPQADWLPQARLTGFPLYDESETGGLSVELQQFLDASDLPGGDPPIAFTPGSAMWQAESFFTESAEACRLIGRRGLLLSRHADHIPKNLPPGVIHVPYAPFSKLLPRCAALVHHGGIGSSAQAMSAGVPQLIMPFAHDQPDNARRLENLGVARSIPLRKYRAARVAETLSELIQSPQIAESCRKVARHFPDPAAVPKTCELIETLAR